MRLRQHLEALRLRRAPVTEVEEGAAAVAATAMAAALRRERMSTSPDRFPLHEFNLATPSSSLVEAAAAGAYDRFVSVLFSVPLPVPKRPTLATEPDTDARALRELPDTKKLALKYLDDPHFLPPLSYLPPIDLPWRAGWKPDWKKPRRWGAGMRVEDLDPSERAETAALIAKEMSTGALEMVTREDQVRLACPAFVVRRELNGKLRLVHDLRPLNSRLNEAPTKYEDIKHAILHSRRFASKLDLASAFKHVPLSEEASSVMAFQVGGATLRWTRLPFGMSHSPRLFTAALAPTIDEIRKRHGIQLTVYVDDILVSADDVEALDVAMVVTLATLETAGWRIAPDKVHYWAYDRILFLGLILDLDGETPAVRIPASKAAKLGRLVEEAVSKPRVTLHLLQRITGLLAFFLLAAPTIGLFWRHLIAAQVEAEGLPGRHVWVRGGLLAELTFWQGQALDLPNWATAGSLVAEAPEQQAVTDASEHGVGAIWWRPGTSAPDLKAWVEGKIEQSDAVRFLALPLPDWAIGESSQFRELVGIILLMQRWKQARATLDRPPPGMSELELDEWRSSLPFVKFREKQNGGSKFLPINGGRSSVAVRWFSDSTAAVAAATKWRSGSVGSTLVLQKLSAIASELDCVVHPVWVSRNLQWLAAADFLSRELGRAIQPEWSLDPQTYRSVCSRLRTQPTVDMFASKANAQCKAFRSRYPEAGSGGDAFGSPWPDADVYAFPPFSQVARALRAWQRGRGAGRGRSMVLVAPSDHPDLDLAEGSVVARFHLQAEKLIDSGGVRARNPFSRRLVALKLVRPLTAFSASGTFSPGQPQVNPFPPRRRRP